MPPGAYPFVLALWKMTSVDSVVDYFPLNHLCRIAVRLEVGVIEELECPCIGARAAAVGLAVGSQKSIKPIQSRVGLGDIRRIRAPLYPAIPSVGILPVWRRDDGAVGIRIRDEVDATSDSVVDTVACFELG